MAGNNFNVLAALSNSQIVQSLLLSCYFGYQSRNAGQQETHAFVLIYLNTYDILSHGSVIILSLSMSSILLQIGIFLSYY